MERKRDEDGGFQRSNISINSDDDDYGTISEKEDDGLSVLKKEIACHSMYGLLVESHLNCLKLCLGNMKNIVDVTDHPTAPPNRSILFTANQSELDQFMEAYCMTLKEVKEGIEGPQQESMEFINCMYSQLEELLVEIPPSSHTLKAIVNSSRSKDLES